jgi:tight adherence protein B
VVSRHAAVAAVFAFVSVLAIASPRAPVAFAADEVSIREVDVAEFPMVQLVVSTQEAVALDIGDVELLENGVAVDVADVYPLGVGIGGVDAVLAIDVSNSMRGGALSTALAAARTFLAGVPASMPLGVLTFSDQPVVLSPVTTDRASVEQAVASIGGSTSSGTALFDAVAQAAALFEPGAETQHNLILVTDGRNTTGATDLTEAVATAREARMHVFTVGLASPDTDETTLRTLAIETGATYAAISAAELGSVYAGLASEFTRQYVVEYRSKAPLAAPVTVELRLPVGSATIGFLAPGITQLPAETHGAKERLSIWTEPIVMGVVVGLTFLTVVALGLLVLGFDARRRRERRLRSRLVPVVDAGNPEDAYRPDRTTFIPDRVADVAERLAGSGAGERLSRRLEHAGWALRGGEFLSIVAISAVLSGLLGSVAIDLVGALLGVVLGVTVPFALLSRATARRQAAIQAQLADTLMVIASSMRAGHSFLQSLDSAAKEIDDPAAGELGRVLTEIRLGRDIDDALEALVGRVGSQDLEWAVTAIKIQRKTGGNLAEVLETVAKTIRERETLRRQVRVLSAEGRISVIVLTVLPILIAVYLMLVNPEYLKTLTTTTPGIIISSVAGVLMAFGYLWMRKIVRLNV